MLQVLIEKTTSRTVLCVCWSLSHVQLCDPRAPLSRALSRQEYWSGLPCPSPGDLPDPGMEKSYTGLNLYFHDIFFKKPIRLYQAMKGYFADILRYLRNPLDSTRQWKVDYRHAQVPPFRLRRHRHTAGEASCPGPTVIVFLLLFYIVNELFYFNNWTYHRQLSLPKVFFLQSDKFPLT